MGRLLLGEGVTVGFALLISDAGFGDSRSKWGANDRFGSLNDW
jgi:hypothetical protein